MDIRGDDPFRLRSYRNAAEAIGKVPTRCSRCRRARDCGAAGASGVGKATPGKILELLDRGTFDRLERSFWRPLKACWILEPPALVPRRRLLHQKYKVSSIEHYGNL